MSKIIINNDPVNLSTFSSSLSTISTQLNLFARDKGIASYDIDVQEPSISIHSTGMLGAINEGILLTEFVSQLTLLGVQATVELGS